jgi:hypothetical protein
MRLSILLQTNKVQLAHLSAIFSNPNTMGELFSPLSTNNMDAAACCGALARIKLTQLAHPTEAFSNPNTMGELFRIQFD